MVANEAHKSIFLPPQTMFKVIDLKGTICPAKKVPSVFLQEGCSWWQHLLLLVVVFILFYFLFFLKHMSHSICLISGVFHFCNSIWNTDTLDCLKLSWLILKLCLKGKIHGLIKPIMNIRQKIMNYHYL